MKNKFALVSDFDGTISGDDFFFYITDKYLDKEAMQPWNEYLAGEKSHFNALKEIFAKLRVDEDDLDEFIGKIDFDKKFFNVADLCNNLDIPLYICSAGCDYYIRLLIGHEMDTYKITLITNYSFYSKSMGLQISRLPQSSPYYDYNTGIDKSKLVKELQGKGYKVIYCGDGIPDFGAATIADVVFARKTLAEKCQTAGIKFIQLKSFEQVYDYIKENC